MRKLSMILTCALLSLGADDPKGKDTELDRFQGSWKASKATMDGMEVAAGDLKELDMTVKGDQATRPRDPKNVATLKIDAGKTPAEIDFEDKNKKIDHGIYRFVDKDTLEMCAAFEGAERPKDFAAAKESKRILIVLKREK